MNLANVVKQRSGFDLLNLSRGQTKLDCDCPRELADTNRVARGIRISGFDGFDHHLKEFLTAVLKLMIESVHMPDSDNRNDDTDQAKRAEAEPSVERSV